MGTDRAVPRILWASGALLLLALLWAVIAGVRLGRAESAARAAEARLRTVHEVLEDKVFRAQLAEAVKTLGEDAVPFRIRLNGLCGKHGIVLDGAIGETGTGVRNSDQTDTVAAFSYKNVSLSRFLTFACDIELSIPGAVVTDTVLKPVPNAGDSWEVPLFKVTRRAKSGP